tara:strand:- start:10010 stop:10981 length:972 start_codon:yes stop_codon:yes gene_type:complete
MKSSTVKVTLAFDLGHKFVSDLQATFPNVEFRTAYSPEERLKEAPDTEVQFGLIDRETYLAASNLRWFHFIGIGFDGTLKEIPEIIDSDTIMTNTRETHVIPISEHVFAMMLAFAHRVPELLDDQHKHHWETKKYKGRIIELANATMGVVAMGDIGTAVAKRAQAFDMDVYAVDIKEMNPPPGVAEVWDVSCLDDLLKISDWLVITAPLTDQTRDMIGLKEIERLKSGAHVIVVSRGSIVNEAALIQGLRSGHIAGAALDATATEPLPSDSPLWDEPNVIISPHACAESTQLLERRGQIFKENLRRYLSDDPLINLCDTEAGY